MNLSTKSKIELKVTSTSMLRLPVEKRFLLFIMPLAYNMDESNSQSSNKRSEIFIKKPP